MSRASLLSGAFRALLLSVAFLATSAPCPAQWTETLTIHGEVTSVEPPDAFDVAGYRVELSKTTQFVSSYGHTHKSAIELRDLIVQGAIVEVFGSKDHSSRTITATWVKVHDDSDRKVSGFAVIDRTITPGAVFRADGYFLRLNSTTEILYSDELNSLSQVTPGIWVHYEAIRSSSGDLDLTRVQFLKPKLSKSKRDPNVSIQQVTTFPPGSLIDFDGGFRTDRDKHKMEDAGGACGWYPVPQEPALQRRIREMGMRLVPQYQRDLPDGDPAKIPFRFYIVDELYIRSDLSCWDGLILIPAMVIDRLHNDDQIAAVLADGVAANLLRQRARVAVGLGLLRAAEAASYAVISPAGIVGTKIAEHTVLRRLEDQRGREALGLMADAGFDPWQAPEAWRLLAPGRVPDNLSRLKYPERSEYQLQVLRWQYKHPARPESTVAKTDSANPN